MEGPSGRLKSTVFNPWLFLDHRDKAKTFPGKRSDQKLLFAAVANGGARGVDPGAHGRVRHGTAVPDGRDQIVLADNAITITDQEFQKVKNLRLQLRQIGPAAQFAPLAVKRVIPELKQQLVGLL